LKKRPVIEDLSKKGPYSKRRRKPILLSKARKNGLRKPRNKSQQRRRRKGMLGERRKRVLGLPSDRRLEYGPKGLGMGKVGSPMA